VVGGRKVMDWTPLDHAAKLEIDAALFEWAERTKPGRVVYFSSSCAYPVALGGYGWQLRENHIGLRQPRWPDQLYGWTKLTGELLAETARGAGVAVSVVRPFSVYGPGMKEGFAVRGFLEQIQRRADPVEVWGNAEQVRDYIHVSDVANAVVAMVEQGIDGPVNLGTGRGTSLAELVALMGKAAGYEPQVKVNTALPAGVQSLVADATLLRSFCPPRVVLEDYLAEAVAP
jgi:UDP-glucose 4-epimerase